MKGLQVTTGNGVPKPKKVFVAPAIISSRPHPIEVAVRRNLRQAKIDKARAEIADGTFETQKKIDATVDRLLRKFTL